MMEMVEPVGRGERRMVSDGGKCGDLIWRGILGSLVLGEQKPRIPGGTAATFPKNPPWGLRLCWLKENNLGLGFLILCYPQICKIDPLFVWVVDLYLYVKCCLRLKISLLTFFFFVNYDFS